MQIDVAISFLYVCDIYTIACYGCHIALRLLYNVLCSSIWIRVYMFSLMSCTSGSRICRMGVTRCL